MGCKRVTVATAWAAAATCACCPFFQTRTTTAAFTIPTTTITRVTHRRPQVNISGQFSASSKARFRDHLAFNRKQVIGRRLYRPRAEATTRTSMVFGFGGGGGRGPRGPLGLEPGTLATIGFVILVLFAPGVILGVFNTLFLVRTDETCCLGSVPSKQDTRSTAAVHYCYEYLNASRPSEHPPVSGKKCQNVSVGSCFTKD